MTYSTFLNNIRIVFTNLLNLLSNVISALLNNYIFKFIIHISIFLFVIFVLYKTIDVIKNIFSMKKESSKQKTKSNSDIE